MAVPGKKVREHLDLILELLARESEGLAVGEIARRLEEERGVDLSPDAIAYRIGLAVPDRVLALGDGKARRYRLRRPEELTAAPATSVDAAGTAPEWMTPEAREIRKSVARPAGERRYQTYRRPWLEAYTPGGTWYLSEGERTHLRRVGATPEADRPAGTFARDILSRLLIDLSWASSRLEGNTYSRLDTQNLIEFGQRADGKDALEAQMILNHKSAIEFLVEPATELRLDELTIRSLHALLSEGLMRDPADEGRLRQKPVRIGGTNYIPTEDPHVIRECFAMIVQKANAITDPFERSFFLMVQLPYLQPFADVNKRTSRLAANIPLIEANLCPLTFVDMPEQEYVRGILGIYEEQRVELLRDLYVFAYERSCGQYLAVRQSLPAPDPLRLRYRDALGRAIVGAVRAGAAPSREDLLARARAESVRTEDLPGFADLALSLLLNLNDASAARHGLRPAEFNAWRARFVPLGR